MREAPRQEQRHSDPAKQQDEGERDELRQQRRELGLADGKRQAAERAAVGDDDLVDHLGRRGRPGVAMAGHHAAIGVDDLDGDDIPVGPQRVHGSPKGVLAAGVAGGRNGHLRHDRRHVLVEPVGFRAGDSPLLEHEGQARGEQNDDRGDQAHARHPGVERSRRRGADRRAFVRHFPPQAHAPER